MGIVLKYLNKTSYTPGLSRVYTYFAPEWSRKSCRFDLFCQNVELRGPGASYHSQVDLATWISPNRGPSETESPEVSMENL